MSQISLSAIRISEQAPSLFRQVFTMSRIGSIYFNIGLVMLIALSAKNAILIVEFAQHLHEKEGKGIMESAIGAAKLRFRPIIMTSLAFRDRKSVV